MKNLNIRTLLIFTSFLLLFFNCGNDDNNKEGNQNEDFSNFRININEDNYREYYDSFNGYIISTSSTNVTYQTNRPFYIVFTDGELSIVDGEIKYSSNTSFLVEYDLLIVSYGDPRIIESGRYEYPSWSSSHFITDYRVKTNIVVSNGNITSSIATEASDNGINNPGSLDLLLNDSYFEIEFYQILSGVHNGFDGKYYGSLIVLEN